MKKILTIFFVTTALISQAHTNLWQQVAMVPSSEKQIIHPDKYLIFNLQTQSLKSILFNIAESPDNAVVIAFPSPDGKMKQFKVWQESMMEPGLAVKFPDIKTFTAVSVDNKRVTAKLDFTLLGFHAMVFDGDNTYFIDPSSNPASNYYLCYYKRDIVPSANNGGFCTMPDQTREIQQDVLLDINKNLPPVQLKQHGTNRYTYRLAMACSGEYSVAAAGSASPTKALSMSAIVSSMNRVNGVYEREVGIHMNLIANNDLLIYLDGTTDPYTNGNGPTMQSENQTNINTVIGVTNYDIGHVVCTGNTGIADLGCVCLPSTKARGVTGQPNPVSATFDIDFIAHEMGHQFGGTHTFNASTSNCGGNTVSMSAYEPGSGSTIMAYAGICGTANNIQAHSDDYFHAKSLDQITDFLTSTGTACAVISASNNIPPALPSINQSYYIPYLTPFELIAPQAVDTDHDTLTYCWEEWDLGDLNASFADTKVSGPIFRSYYPTQSDTRVFTTLNKLRSNITSYLGEKLPEVTRTLKFKLTARDILNGYGTFDIADDVTTLNVTNSSGPFTVLFPNVSSDYLRCGTQAVITWNVANTTAAPVSCTNVNILLSTDNGLTFPYTLMSNTPNDGNETITVPSNIYSAGCRVKVKGAGNVFFDMSDQPFSVFPWPADVSNINNADNDISIYPIPAKNYLNISFMQTGTYDIQAVNTLGQLVWQGEIRQQGAIQVSNWTTGIYNLRCINKNTQNVFVKRVVIE